MENQGEELVAEFGLKIRLNSKNIDYVKHSPPDDFYLVAVDADVRLELAGRLAFSKNVEYMTDDGFYINIPIVDFAKSLIGSCLKLIESTSATAGMHIVSSEYNFNFTRDHECVHVTLLEGVTKEIPRIRVTVPLMDLIRECSRVARYVLDTIIGANLRLEKDPFLQELAEELDVLDGMELEH